MDLIVKSSNIITLDPAQPKAAYVHVKDGRIIRVGQQLTGELKGLKSEVIDCGDKAVLPGFIDCHCHPFAIVSQLLSVNCSPENVHCIDDIVRLIAEQAHHAPEKKWIKATGYNEFYLQEKRHPTRYDLDRMTTTHPVRLMHRTGHACVLNTAALRMVGISKETPDPPGGLIDRDTRGEPTGLLYEMNSRIDQFIPPETDDDFHNAAYLLNLKLLSNGITSLHDASANNSIEQFKKWAELKKRGIIRSRVRFMTGIHYLEELFEGKYNDYEDRGDLDTGAVKIVLDTTTGNLYPDEVLLTDYIEKLFKQRIQVAVHAIEEDAIELVNKVISISGIKFNFQNHRSRIEHCSVCPPRLIYKIKNSGAIVVTQPSFIYYNGERYIDTVPPEQQKYLYPAGSLIRSSIAVAGSSDAPVVPISPLMGIYAAVSRWTEGGRSILADEKLSIIQAIELYTKMAAYAGYEENIKGTISPGKVADIIVLNGNPLDMDAEEIKSLKVNMTIINGQVVWKS